MMKRKTVAAAAIALLMASTLGLSACSNEIVAQSGDEVQSAANLDLERISSVLDATGQAMTKADASLNAADLSGRVTQGALDYRTAQYALATASTMARSIRIRRSVLRPIPVSSTYPVSEADVRCPRGAPCARRVTTASRPSSSMARNSTRA